MTESASPKLCLICRQDCSGRPRVRDGQGRYACRSCVDERKRTHPAAKPSREPRKPVPDFLAGVKAPEPVGATCPGCGKRLPVGNVLCLSCGTNAETGLQAGTNVKLQRQKPVKASTASIGIGAAASAGGGASGVLLWFLIHRATSEPTLVMTVLVGAMAGAGMLIPIRGSGRLVTGLIATGSALGSIIIGLLAFDPGKAPDTFEFVWYSADSYTLTPELVEVENLGEDEYGTAGALWLALGCCAAFALGSSNPDPNPEDEVAP